MRDIWRVEITKHDGVGAIDGLAWMSRTTLDIIGLAGKLSLPTCDRIAVIKDTFVGFNYKIDSLYNDAETENELMKSFSTILKTGANLDVISMLKAMYPALRFLVRINILTSSSSLSNLQYSRHEGRLTGKKLSL